MIVCVINIILEIFFHGQNVTHHLTPITFSSSTLSKFSADRCKTPSFYPLKIIFAVQCPSIFCCPVTAIKTGCRSLLLVFMIQSFALPGISLFFDAQTKNPIFSFCTSALFPFSFLFRIKSTQCSVSTFLIQGEKTEPLLSTIYPELYLLFLHDAFQLPELVIVMVFDLILSTTLLMLVMFDTMAT